MNRVHDQPCLEQIDRATLGSVKELVPTGASEEARQQLLALIEVAAYTPGF